MAILRSLVDDQAYALDDPGGGEEGGRVARRPVPTWPGEDPWDPAPQPGPTAPSVSPEDPSQPGPEAPSPGGAQPRTPVRKGQNTETPRERSILGAGVTSAPTMPSVPTPEAGAVSEALDTSSSTGVVPFTPMPGPTPIAQATLRAPSLFGAAGGLTGGGLGLPQDPTSRANNDTIEGLIKLLRQQG